jgi:hypothetical protein
LLKAHNIFAAFAIPWRSLRETHFELLPKSGRIRTLLADFEHLNMRSRLFPEQLPAFSMARKS